MNLEQREGLPSRLGKAYGFSFLLGFMALWGCHPSGTDPLAYVGSGFMARHLMPDLISAYEHDRSDHFGEVRQSNSQDGFQRVMEDESGVIGGVSRALNHEERLARPYYAVVGYDALGVFVHPTNPIENLSQVQLKALFTGEVRNWKEVGGPDAPVETFLNQVDAEQGMPLAFQEMAMESAPFGSGKACQRHRECLGGVATHPNGVTFASISVNVPGVKRISVDGLQPDARAIRSGRYLLVNPLMLLTHRAPQGRARAFLEFAVSPAGQAIVSRTFWPVVEEH